MDFIGILALGALAYYGYSISNTPTPVTPWIEDVSKSRSLQAKGDASMYIEKIRRQAIQSVGRLDPQKLKETRTQLGSTTGAIETYMISGYSGTN